MSLVAAIASMQATVKTIIPNTLTEEPTTIQRTPLAYFEEVDGQLTHVRQMANHTDRIRLNVMVLVGQSLAPYIDAIPTLLHGSVGLNALDVRVTNWVADGVSVGDIRYRRVAFSLRFTRSNGKV